MARPRSEEAHKKVLAAAAELVATAGISGFTVDAVAKTSGVAKTTIYRRWASGDELLMEVLEHSIERVEAPNTGSLRQDLVVLYRAVMDMFAQPPMLSVMLGVLGRSATDPDFRRLTLEFERERHLPLRAVLEAARDRGEIAADADLELMMEFVEGPVLVRKVIRMESFGPGEIERTVDMVVAGLTA